MLRSSNGRVLLFILMVAAGAARADPRPVTILYPGDPHDPGDVEATQFRLEMEAFAETNGLAVAVEGFGGDADAVRQRLASGEAADLAVMRDDPGVFSAEGPIPTLARERKIVPLSFLNRKNLVRDYGEYLADRASYLDHLYAVYVRITNVKSPIWLSRPAFAA